METTRHFVATVYAVHDGAVALHEHDKLEMWLPAGGHLDRDELPHEAALREAREESGAVCRGPRYAGSVSYRAKGEDVVCAFYRAELVKLGQADEDRERRWVPLGELGAAMPFPETAEIVRVAEAMGPGPAG